MRTFGNIIMGNHFNHVIERQKAPVARIQVRNRVPHNINVKSPLTKECSVEAQPGPGPL